MKNKILDISDDNKNKEINTRNRTVKKEIYRLQIEKDILEKAAIKLKKRKGHQS